MRYLLMLHLPLITQRRNVILMDKIGKQWYNNAAMEK